MTTQTELINVMSGLAALLTNSLEDLTLLLAQFSFDMNKKWLKDLM